MSEKLNRVADFIRKLKRAMQGQELDADKFAYLMDLEDIRERTSLSEHDVYGHSVMRLLAAEYDELAIYGRIAEMEDHYAISKDGEGKKIAATIAVGKKEQTAQGQVYIGLPPVSTKPEELGQEQKKKRGLFHRG